MVCLCRFCPKKGKLGKRNWLSYSWIGQKQKVANLNVGEVIGGYFFYTKEY